MMQTNVKIDDLESKQPTKIGNYILSDRICNDEPISMSSNNVGFNYKQYPTNKFHIELESELRGMEQKLSKYPTYKNLNEYQMSVKSTERPESNNFITNIGEQTRLSKSCYDSTMDISSRFDPLPQYVHGKPQENPIFKEDIRGGYNSRIV